MICRWLKKSFKINTLPTLAKMAFSKKTAEKPLKSRGYSIHCPNAQNLKDGGGIKKGRGLYRQIKNISGGCR